MNIDSLSTSPQTSNEKLDEILRQNEIIKFANKNEKEQINDPHEEIEELSEDSDSLRSNQNVEPEKEIPI